MSVEQTCQSMSLCRLSGVLIVAECKLKQCSDTGVFGGICSCVLCLGVRACVLLVVYCVSVCGCVLSLCLSFFCGCVFVIVCLWLCVVCCVCDCVVVCCDVVVCCLLRSETAHCDLARAVEVRHCPLQSGACC